MTIPAARPFIRATVPLKAGAAEHRFTLPNNHVDGTAITIKAFETKLGGR